MINRTMLFLIGCIGIRLLLALLVKHSKSTYLPLIATLSLIPAFGFLFLYLFDLRKTGLEAGGKIWWTKIRPIHAMLILLFALYAFKRNQHAWIILIIDALVGLLVWWLHYYTHYCFIIFIINYQKFFINNILILF